MPRQCPNPYCRDGWVERVAINGGSGPCYVCRKHVVVVKRREDTHTTTVDGATAAEAELYGPRRGPLFHAMPSERERPDQADVE